MRCSRPTRRASALALSAIALAWPARSWAADNARATAGVTLVFAVGGGDGDPQVRHISPTLAADYQITPSLAAAVDWGVSRTSYAAGAAGENSHFGPGNALFSARYTFVDGPALALRGSLGIAAPLAFRAGDLSDRVTADLGYTMAARARGSADLWAWTMNTVSLVTRWSAHSQLTPGLTLGGHAALGALLPISEPISTTKAALQARAEITYAAGSITPGLAVQIAASSRPLAADDFAAFSLEPFVCAESSSSFARLGLTLNLAAPGDKNKNPAPWGLSVGGGARF